MDMVEDISMVLLTVKALYTMLKVLEFYLRKNGCPSGF